MSLCKNCCYNPWEARNPVSEQEFLERLGDKGVAPTSEGLAQACVGSPFRSPRPEIIRLCCLDKQMCDQQRVNFSAMNSKRECEQAINTARKIVYQEVGLPTISGES